MPLEHVTVEMAREVIRRHEMAEQASESNLDWPKSEPDTVAMVDANPDEVVGLSHHARNYRQHRVRVWGEVEVIDLTGDD